MKRTYIMFTIAAAGLLIFGAGCGQSAAEKAAEDAAHQASNGAVDLDVSGQSANITINTNEGVITGSVGENVTLPDDFPSDVYIIDGTIKTAVAKTGNAGYSISIETDKTVTEAKALYDAELAADGWTETFSINVDDGASISATKENRNLTVLINSIDGQTTIMVGTGENEE